MSENKRKATRKVKDEGPKTPGGAFPVLTPHLLYRDWAALKVDGRLLQYLGRVLRPAQGKDRAKVYDYVDPVGVLEHSAKARQRVYEGESCKN